MSLPTSDPLPPKDDSARAKQPAAAHRRRKRGIVIPAGGEARAAFLQDLAYRVTPSFDFFLFTMLAGLALAIAILIDSPAFFILAALLSPFMAPVAGLAFATILGSPRFFLRMLGAILLGTLIVFAWGGLAGLAARLWPGLTFRQVAYHARFSWPDLALLVLGAALTAFTLVRSPKQRPLVVSVALAYELYLPAGVAGFGLAAGLPGLWPDGLAIYGMHLAIAALTGAVMLILLGLRPLTGFGYGLGALISAASLGALLVAFTGGATPLPLVAIPGMPAAAITQAVPSPTIELADGPALTAMPPAATPSGGAALRSATPYGGAALRPATPYGGAALRSATPYGGAALRSATSTAVPSRTPTNTLVPSLTPTETITPAPTPVWAYVHSEQGGGAVLHDTPSFKGSTITSILNGNLVEILPESTFAEGVTWVKIRTSKDVEGWIIRSLLTTATPIPPL